MYFQTKIKFLLIIFAFIIPAQVFAQQSVLNKTVTINAKQETLYNIFTSIHKQTGGILSYDSQLIDEDKKVDIQIKNEPLHKVLALLLPNNVTYKQMGKYIILTSAEPEKKLQENTSTVINTDKTGNDFEKDSIHNHLIDNIDTIFIQNNHLISSGMLRDSCHNSVTTINMEDMNNKLKLLMINFSNDSTLSNAKKENKLFSSIDNMSRKTGLFILGLATTATTVTAQTEQVEQANNIDNIVNETTTESPVNESKVFQLTFVYPLGTDGTKTFDNEYNLSLNVLGGNTGKITGTEMAMIYNINKYSMTGLQLSGIFNMTGVAKNDAEASMGIQAAGIFNYNRKGNVQQYAGIANIGDEAVLQAAGIANVSKSTSNVQLAGIANASKKSNAQVSGILNLSDSTNIQVAGIANVARASTCQIAPLVNVTKKGGFQLGLVNVRDTTDGVSLGLINIVRKNGLMEWEVAGGEMLHASVSFRSGTQKLYGIITAGYNFDDEFAAFGYGLGTEITLKDRWKLNIEGVHFNLYSKKFDSDKYNGLVQMRPIVSFKVAEHLKVFAGPTLNLSIIDHEDIKFTVPYTIWDTDSDSRIISAWVGFTAGLRF